MNDENGESFMVFQPISSKKIRFYFSLSSVKSIDKRSLEQNVSLKKIATLTCLYGPMYLELDDYPQYSDLKSVIFDTHINRNLRFIHGYTNCVAHNYLITWVSKNYWEMLLSEFSQAEK